MSAASPPPPPPRSSGHTNINNINNNNNNSYDDHNNDRLRRAADRDRLRHMEPPSPHARLIHNVPGLDDDIPPPQAQQRRNPEKRLSGPTPDRHMPAPAAAAAPATPSGYCWTIFRLCNFPVVI
jgi:hypothetical protein